MLKRCTECGNGIDHVNVKYSRYNTCYYQTTEDDDGTDYDNEEELDYDTGDTEDYEYFCPECGDEIVCWDDLEDFEDEDDEDDLSEEELIERDRIKRKQNLKLKRELKKKANIIMLNGIFNNIK
jgi:hypothetical protein